MDLKNIFGDVIVSAAVSTIKDLVIAAVRAKANLRAADLRGANLSKADLCGADLCGAHLSGANLSGANLPSPTIVLLAYWGNVSDEITADLMEFDASNHPDRSAFDKWAQGGDCPYVGAGIQRSANFNEKKRLWGHGKPQSAFVLMTRLFAEKGIKR